jgi:Outer membrane receptor proteins, mostly Fe transport
LAIRGGSDKYTYSASLNYTKETPYNTYSKSDRIGYNIKSQYNFFKWLQADISVIGSISNYNNRGFDPTSLLYGRIAPYTMIYDEDGKQIEWRKSKSRQEINRLIGLGLYDETYYPLVDRELYEDLSKSTYNNINIGLKLNIIDGLTGHIRFQNEFENGKNSSYISGDSYQMRNNINDATVINASTGEKKLHIPEGGYINETRLDKTSYTLRAQLDYYKEFNNKHEINAIAGAERRKVRSTSTFIEKYGYDPNSLAYKLLDENVLSANIDGTESLSGAYRHKRNGWPDVFGDYEDRYVSFYANASYTFNRKYSVTAGIRMDQSNLFGTDPKYQYRPLWSVGLSWYMKEENFLKNVDWINQLNLRATYGINGNIAKTSGPYMIVFSEGANSWTGEYSSSVLSPPNSGLKWERTNQLNLGIDFTLFNYRLSGSLEYYNKNTIDLLDNIAADPTSGWAELQMNYASLYNRGIEVRLNSRNIMTKDFEWNTSLNFSYNKNKVTKRINSLNATYDYVENTNTREGMPIGTLYSVRYAGLDDKGAPLAYKADGTIVSSFWDLEIEDLKQEKSVLPPYSASLINNIQYKGFDFSLMFTYYGGHVMRAPMASFLTDSNIGNGTLKDTRNYWKKPEDSKDPNKSPAFMKNASWDIEYLWIAADKHVKKCRLHKIT